MGWPKGIPRSKLILMEDGITRRLPLNAVPEVTVVEPAQITEEKLPTEPEVIDLELEGARLEVFIKFSTAVALAGGIAKARRYLSILESLREID